MSISEDTIQKVKEQNDIVEVISESVRLKKSGRNYQGLCPFHHEKTPSFSVSSDKQIYKCFGCGEAGSVITFVMKSRNLTFMDAVKLLAERANIPIVYDGKENGTVKDPRDKLYKINIETARFFYSNLQRAKEPLDYLINRGITINTIKKFGLGFAPDSWNALINHLKKKNYTELDMISAGLILKSSNGNYYDRFRNRIIFPVFDYMGRVIGFGGRVMDDSKPKYLNSPETSIFKKGINLYGLNFSIKERNLKEFIVVEGYMDCISLHQQGITNAVASLGTALTVSQAKLMKRYAGSIVISYDADAAGQNAALRGMELLKSEGFDIRVLTVPQGKDPDEYIKSNGREAFLRLVENSLPFMDYRLKKLSEKVDFNNNEATANYAKEAALMISALNPVERDVYVNKIAEETSIKVQAIYDLLRVENQKNVNKSQLMNNKDENGQKLLIEPAYIKAERTLLKLMLIEEEAFLYITEHFAIEEFILQSHKKLYDLIVECRERGVSPSVSYIEAHCTEVETSGEWVNIQEFMLEYDSDNFKKIISDCIREINKYRLEESKKQIMNKIKQLEAEGKITESVALAQELIVLQKSNKNI